MTEDFEKEVISHDIDLGSARALVEDGSLFEWSIPALQALIKQKND
jgi:hypothetical protein